MALLGTRTAATALALATGIALITPHTAVAATPPTDSELESTASFLAAQLTERGDGLVDGPFGGRADLGLTADFIFALDALDMHHDQADRSYEALVDNADDFVYFLGEVDAGRMAKFVALQNTRGERNETYIAELVDAIQDNGRLMNETDGEPTSDAQNFSQAWAVIALARAGETEAASKAADFLESQICEDGGVPLFPATPPTCTSVDPDTTGMAGQALALVRGAEATSTRSVLQYLRNNTTPEGGINSRFAGINVNSTALAAGAFAYAGDLDAFERNHAFLDAVRFDDSAPEELRGGFAYKISDVDTVTTVSDQIRRATAQAALGFVGGSYASSETLYPEQVDPDPVDPDPVDPAPSDSDGSSSGSSEGGIFLGVLGAIAAIIAAVIGFTGTAAFLPVQF
ncbi:hypothetical protein HMPREF0290_1188 [Corynebacterium efficiens YS-314]|nr:terpene cyclase/mutase family protein [Corynebacterium efficiens]EEW50193.1 hypothetical protein HMPREF0290_1188 [Corynebacterium efficiens YS-314]